MQSGKFLAELTAFTRGINRIQGLRDGCVSFAPTKRPLGYGNETEYNGEVPF